MQSAKTVAENALSTIGAFPAAQASPDPGELRKALIWLEMILNFESGIRPVAGFWQVFEIPLEANVGDYLLPDFSEAEGVSHVFSVCLVDANGNTDPINFQYENDALLENLQNTGVPHRVTITKDKDMKMKLYPMPTQVQEDAGLIVRVRVQTWHDKIDNSGMADEDLKLRPSWYLWLTKRLAYEIGCGPVRRLAESELDRLQNDMQMMADLLYARDGQYQGPVPPVQDPVPGSVD